MISLNHGEFDVDAAIASEDDRLQISRPPDSALLKKMQRFYTARPDIELRLYWWPKDVVPSFLRELPMLERLGLDQYGSDERLPELTQVSGRLKSLEVTSRGALDLSPISGHPLEYLRLHVASRTTLLPFPALKRATLFGKFAGLESLSAARALERIDVRLERRSLEQMGALAARAAYVRGHCHLDELSAWPRLRDLSVVGNRELSALQGLELSRLHLGNIPGLSTLAPIANRSVRALSLYNLSALRTLDDLDAFTALQSVELAQLKSLSRAQIEAAVTKLSHR